MKAIVNKSTRYAKMRAHTATHLLHFFLDKLLDGTKQAGSLVDDDYLRFDFATKQPLTPKQLHILETRINTCINAALPVNTKEMNYDAAVAAGAKAFFEDKYDDIVRVVQIHGEDGPSIDSIELCGGTHVANTQDIGACKIIDQQSVASGVRRIIAVTGTKVIDYTYELETQLQTIATKVDCQPKQLEEKIDKLLRTLQTTEKNYTQLQEQIIVHYLQELKGVPHDILGNMYNLENTPLASMSFKEVVTQAKLLRPEDVRCIYTPAGNFALWAGSTDTDMKTFAQQHTLKGGGSAQLVQGKDEKIANVVKG